MSTVKTNNVQVGQSGTATNNFTLYQPSTPDGTVRLGVGNAGATSSDVITANSSGNVGIGVTPSAWTSTFKPLQFGSGGAVSGRTDTNTTAYFSTNAYRIAGGNWAYIGGGAASLYAQDDGLHIWYGAASGSAGGTITYTERARIDSSGNLLVGKTAYTSLSTDGCTFNPSGYVQTSFTSSPAAYFNRNGTDGGVVNFYKSGTNVGSVSVTGSATAYNTSSDYRLKEDIQPMTGALAKVQSLKPVTYKWKVDGSDGEGFIAHELAEVCPDAVTGEKDAVETYTDEDGNEQTRPVYQGIDTSFLVATLTAAIQELNAKVEAQAAEIAALKAQ